MRTALNIATVGNLNVAFRSGARKVFILVTNEDSDPPTYQQNVFSSFSGGHSYVQASSPHDGLCFGPAPGSDYPIIPLSKPAWDNSWQLEIDSVASGLISQDSSLYMFAAGWKDLDAGDIDIAQDCNAYYQYCNPNTQVQSSTFSDFDPTLTLGNMTANGEQNSLQGQLLAAGLVARCFDVADATNADLINNFFGAIVTDMCACNPCLQFPCNGSQCLPPVNICGCDGIVDSGTVSDSHGGCCLQSQLDCAGFCGNSHSFDPCGVCTLGGQLSAQCQDCRDKDPCGVCLDTPNNNTTSNCTADCKGQYHLPGSPSVAFVDACGDCWFANQSALANSNRDPCGTCWPGGSSNPGWDSEAVTFDSQGKSCRCGQVPLLCADNVTTTCTDSCPNYALCAKAVNFTDPGSPALPDSCGRCPGDSMYNKGLDDCGICCDPENGVPCNQDKDSCGVCFGFNSEKSNPCHICDRWFAYGNGTCQQDCSGVWGGNKTIGCDGICGSNATCVVCGDGKIEPGESCDLGSKNGKNLNVPGSGCNNCTAEAAFATGAVAGGVIGGVAAIVALALAAFFAYRYARKSGMTGTASQQVDFGATSTNPLYKGNLEVHTNPLYTQ